nr:hypothetical protein CFP56_69087 [Quercus suber]
MSRWLIYSTNDMIDDSVSERGAAYKTTAVTLVAERSVDILEFVHQPELRTLDAVGPHTERKPCESRGDKQVHRVPEVRLLGNCHPGSRCGAERCSRPFRRDDHRQPPGFQYRRGIPKSAQDDTPIARLRRVYVDATSQWCSLLSSTRSILSASNAKNGNTAGFVFSPLAEYTHLAMTYSSTFSCLPVEQMTSLAEPILLVERQEALQGSISPGTASASDSPKNAPDCSTTCHIPDDGDDNNETGF